MRCVTGDHQQKRLHNALPGLPGIGLQLDLRVLVQPDAILQFDLLKLRRGKLARIEVLGRYDLGEEKRRKS